MRVVERFITRARPDAVWQTIAGLRRWPEWTSAILQIQPLDGDDVIVGARYRVSRPRLRPAVFQVTSLLRNRQFTWTSMRPGLSLVGDYKVLQTTAGTEVQLSFEVSGWLEKPYSYLYGGILARHLSTEVLNLRDHCRALAGPARPMDVFVRHRPPA